MRKIVVLTMVSLDGVMQAPSGPEEDTSLGFKYGGWTVPYVDESLGDRIDEELSVPVDLLLGRKTYEIFAPYWPKYRSAQIRSRLVPIPRLRTLHQVWDALAAACTKGGERNDKHGETCQ